MSLTPERLTQARVVWEKALALPVGDRRAFVLSAVPDDPDLATFVLELLAAHEATGDVFSRPLAEQLGFTRATLRGRMLGAYRVTGELGQGGMGTVYDAVRADDQFTKRVAIKTLQAGTDSAEMLRRFRREREIQAALAHPNIATLLDAGVSEDGVPYIVLEFVDGLPIDEYCVRNRLGLRARLDLFRQVISAVEHAHRQLVIHRDLKPNNVLVTTDGVVKLLDFGISKLIDDSVNPETTAGDRAFTTAYASPEQIKGASMSTATDVYSLGVMLYRLLSGQPPFDVRDTSPTEAWRQICEQAPPPPSAVATAEAASSMGLGSADRLGRALRGELDAIVLVALRKEPDRRYRSASALGDDLHRYLRGLPVEARPDSARYRLGKLVRRNRVATVAVSLGAVAMIGGTIVSTWQAREARRERAVADRERQTALRVSGFLEDIIASANPTYGGRGLGPEATLTDAVNVAAQRIDRELGSEPEVALALHRVMAHTYVQLRQADRAAHHARREVELLRALGSPPLELARGLYDLGAQLRYSGHPDSAVIVLQEAYAVVEREGFPAQPEVSNALNELGLALWAAGRPREAAPILEHALRITQLLSDSLSQVTVGVTSSNLGNVYYALGDLAGAERQYRLTEEILTRTNRNESVERGAILNNLTTVLILTGAYEEAEQRIKEGIALLERLLGATNERVAISRAHLARIELATGRAPQALETLRGAAVMLNHLRPQHPERARSETYEAAILLALGRLGEAEVIARRALATRRLVGAATDWRIGETEAILGRILVARGKGEEARALFESSLRTLRASMGDAHPLTREVEKDLRSQANP